MDELLLCARALVALVLLAAGVGKLVNVPGSRAALRGFGVPERLAAPGGVALPVVELVLAAALLADPVARVGAIATVLLLGAFVVAIARALRAGRAPDCHCFGQLHSAPVGRGTLARNAALVLVALLVAIAGPGDGLDGLDAAGWALVGLAALAAGLALAVLALLRRVRSLAARAAAARPPLPVGTVAPAVALLGPGDEPTALDAVLAADRPTGLVFVDPGCAPCGALVPELARWAVGLSGALSLVVVSRGSEPDNVVFAAAARDGGVPVLRGDDALEAFRIEGTPGAVLVGPDGTIASAPALGAAGIEALVRVAVRRPR